MPLATPLTKVKDALIRSKVIPDVIPESFEPTTLFAVSYEETGIVEIGQEVDVDDAQKEPDMTLLSINGVGDAMKKGCAYTVALVDPDARPLEGKTIRLFRHWLVRSFCRTFITSLMTSCFSSVDHWP